MQTLKLISIAHSYCVAMNRRLAHEMAREGEGRWEVTAVAPAFFHGDLRPVPFEPYPGERCRTVAVPVHLSRIPHAFFYGGALRNLLRGRWDVVHCWQEPYVVSGGQIARWSSRDAAFVFSTCQNIAKRYPPPFAQIERFTLARSAGWIPCGESVAEAQTGRGFETRPYRVLPFGVDTKKFRPEPAARSEIRSRLGWSANGPPVVGYLGRFVEEKGLRVLMSALENLRSEWRALFVGSGAMEPQLRAWAARFGDRARIVTGVRHDDVPAWLNAMDILSAPSQTRSNWREQFGRMIVEAFACGVPVIASDSGELPHVVGDAGAIVAESDVDAWADAIATLIENPGRRAEMAARGTEIARIKYAWPVVARGHLQFFEELLASRRG